MKKYFLLFFIYFLSTKNTFTFAFEIENIPKLKVERIDNVFYSLSGIKEYKNIYFYTDNKKTAELLKKGEHYYIGLTQNETKYELSFLHEISTSDTILYGFKFIESNTKTDFINKRNQAFIGLYDWFVRYKYDKCIFCRKIIFSEGETIGSGKDLLIFIPNLEISDKPEFLSKEALANLADEIICKKFNFKSINDYKTWKSNFNKLYVSLNIGNYLHSSPFNIGDLTFLEKNLFSIEDMTFSNGKYKYLVTASKNQLSKCCIIISKKELNHILYNGNAVITELLLLKCIGQEEYKSGYNIYKADVWESLDKNSPESKMINEMTEIMNNPRNYKYILSEE